MRCSSPARISILSVRWQCYATKNKSSDQGPAGIPDQCRRVPQILRRTAMNTQVKSNRGRTPKLATFNSVVAAVLLALISIVTPLGFAQTANTGAVAGTVTDSSGAVVVGADLALTNSATGEIRRVIS